MANKMLIDASHPEETRVVVTRGNRVEEFDFESASRKQLRGNIYLAKVTRVEPSLQAAFVDFGGNRHGFLAFSEIHPDYYQIPVADREALLADEAARARREDEDEEGGRGRRERSETGRSEARGDGRRGRRDRGRNRPRSAPKDAASGEAISAEASEFEDENSHDNGEAHGDQHAESRGESEGADHAVAEENAGDEPSSRAEPARADDARAEPAGDEHADEDDEPREEEVIEQAGGSDALEELPTRHHYSRRQYKIQEVIKRRQILLIQVVKEERGNKGAALTTYLSLAGRYSVLMPNTARGGGISRKITNGPDRKRLKDVVGDLEVPEGMGIILRTAGASRTKPEIKRDFEYLLRVWETVRELTLQSTAPALVYEEGSLIKRAIRDLYSKDIDDIQVCGEHGYREAKDFMRMLMPSHSRMVQQYREQQPLFAKFGIEAQLDAMFSNNVTLRSGGYIVINQTEALVSIDVNSGRSTREHNIEDTALKTNLEAAEEVARQLRLRDLAGLIVIDFIDMEENRNNRAVERRMKDCLKDDRARIQIGRISHFGLMEMSRQRIRTGVLESSTVPCAHCGGTGFLRSTPSIALQLLRAVEDGMLRAPHHNIIVRTRTEIALYVLNHKRANLSALEFHSGVTILIQADETVLGTTYYVVERGDYVEAAALRPAPVTIAHVPDDDGDDAFEAEARAQADADADEENGVVGLAEDGEIEARSDEGGERQRGRGRRRRRGGRGREDELAPREAESVASEDENEDAEGEGGDEPVSADGVAEDEGARRRRRRRRGGRRNRRDRDESGAPRDGAASDADGAYADGSAVTEIGPAETLEAGAADVVAEPAMLTEEPEATTKPKRGRGRAAKAAKEPTIEAAAEAADAALGVEEPTAEAVKPKRGRKPKVVAITEPDATVPQASVAEESPPMVAIAEAAIEAFLPTVEPAQEPTPAPVAKKPAPEPEPEYTGPKRSGWWSRAKQALGGE